MPPKRRSSNPAASPPGPSGSKRRKKGAPTATSPREKCQQFILKKLYDDNPDMHGYAVSLEKHLYNAVIKGALKDRIPRAWEHKIFRSRYIHKITGTWICLTEPRNEELMKMFRDGSLSFQRLAEDHPFSLCPWNYEEIFDTLAAKQLRRETVSHTTSSKGMFKCGKCKSTDTQYTMMQTRSADEPMTVFVFCTNCSNRWRC